MKYTKEQQIEMLNEMLIEANNEFTSAMAEGRLNDASTELSKLKLITELLKYK